MAHRPSPLEAMLTLMVGFVDVVLLSNILSFKFFLAFHKGTSDEHNLRNILYFWYSFIGKHKHGVYSHLQLCFE